MLKKRFLTLIVLTITALALTVYNSNLPATQAQTSNSTLLTISGQVKNPLNITLVDIEAMPQATEYAVLICVDAPTTPLQQGYWTGVKLSYILQQAGLSSDAIKVAFFAPDGFKTDLPVSTAMQDNSIVVAYQKDNSSLGGTLQLVVPGRWGYKWISALTQIQLVNYDFLGTYESSGYPDDGTSLPQGSSQFQRPTPNTSSFPTATSTTAPTQTLKPTASPTQTLTPPASNIKPQQTSTFLLFIATVSIIIVISAVAAAVILMKRKKTKT